MSIDYSRISSLSVRKVKNALLNDGFVFRRQRGSHRRYYHPDGRRVTLTWHHSSDTLPIGTIRSIFELQAKWDEDDLKRLGLLD